ncbi:MAG: hypothetical protein ACLFVW_04675 [Phycisphaerae bacterium]
MGGILAHELIHAMMARQNWAKVPPEHLEPFTDLAAFFFGLGKLMLNGAILAHPCPAGVLRTDEHGRHDL